MPLMAGNQLHGLVDASGSAGGRLGGTEVWSLIFHLAAWRDDRALWKEALRCEMPVSEPALAEYMKLIGPYSTIEARIKNITPKGVAVLAAVQVFTGEDGDLDNIRNQLLTPVRIDTPRFGILELDGDLGITWVRPTGAVSMLP